MSKRVDEKQSEDLVSKAASVVFAEPEKAEQTLNGNDILRQYLIEEFAEKKRKRDEEHAQLLRLNENSRKSAEDFTRQKEAKQASCAHTQPRGETNVRGQYLSNGKLFLTCQRCQKTWVLPDDNGKIPTYLLPSGDDIGQPSMAH